jgi:hypothetical protein
MYCDSHFSAQHSTAETQQHTWQEAFIDADGDGIDDRVQTRPMCGTCAAQHAQKYCDDCGEYFCDPCHAEGHRKGKKQQHTWQPAFVDEDGDGIDDRVQGAAQDAWEEYTDEESGRVYYYNTLTGETVWGD